MRREVALTLLAATMVTSGCLALADPLMADVVDEVPGGALSARGEGNLTFVVDDSYPEGTSVPVVLRNDGALSYVYKTHYAACDLTYTTADGRDFKVPEGTHCDVMNTDVLEPGESVLLFTWDLDECVKDTWGCAEAEPLPPGLYHVRGTFCVTNATAQPYPSCAGGEEPAGFDVAILPS